MIERRTGLRERRYGGRVVYSRGPIVLALEILQGVTAIAAIVALVIALSVFSSRINEIQTARGEAGTDSCYLLRGLVAAATQPSPASRRAAAAYIARTPLRNCIAYGAQVKGGKQ